MKSRLVNCLIEKTNIEVVMSFEQFKMYNNGELNLAEIKFVNDLDRDLLKLDFNTYRTLLIIISGILSIITVNPTIVAFAGGIESIDRLGNTFLNVVRTGMYWVCIVKGLLDVGKEVTRGGDNLGNIGKIVVKYILAFATLFLLPMGFDIVKETFAQ